MIIQSSNVLLTGQHKAVQKYSKSELLKFWVGNQRPDLEGISARMQLPVRDNVDLSRQSQPQSATSSQDRVSNSFLDKLLQQGQTHSPDNGKTSKTKADELGAAMETDHNLRLVRMLLEMITGKKIDIASINNSEPQAFSISAQANDQATVQPQPAQQQPPTVPVVSGFGLEYDAHVAYSESEKINFSARGIVRTADGKQINFNLQLSMERAFTRQVDVSVRMGDAVRQQQDPLVINFGGTAAQLSDTKFSFDINSDGKVEQTSFVGRGCGFIALDKNNDGTINNGSELFGADSGDGFQDLAEYDQDKNGWIDDNDSVFNQLKVWSKDAQGNDLLVGLKSKGVGALYLGNITTQFELKNSSNESLGTIRSNGVYLNENGSVGTLQQVDLTL